MTERHARPRVDAHFYLALILAGPVTYLIHEGAHWIVGRALGLDVSFSLNGVTPRGGATEARMLALSAAGPAITYAQALLAYLAVRRKANPIAFAFLLWAAFMRVVATGISVVLPNDEARVSLVLGAGYWTLPIITSGALCYLAWAGSRMFDARARDYFASYLILSAVTAAIVFGDQYLL
ncbi:hypothetical protein [Sphingomonas sp. RS2018]